MDFLPLGLAHQCFHHGQREEDGGSRTAASNDLAIDNHALLVTRIAPASIHNLLLDRRMGRDCTLFARLALAPGLCTLDQRRRPRTDAADVLGLVAELTHQTQHLVGLAEGFGPRRPSWQYQDACVVDEAVGYLVDRRKVRYDLDVS